MIFLCADLNEIFTHFCMVANLHFLYLIYKITKRFFYVKRDDSFSVYCISSACNWSLSQDLSQSNIWVKFIILSL